MTSFDVALGRLRLPTAHERKLAAVAAKIDTLGAAVIPGDPAAKPFGVTLPVYGGAPADGQRLRRQVEAMLANAPLLLEGLYYSTTFDPDGDAWIVVGGGDLDEADGGQVFGEYALSLEDAYVVGRPSRHRRGYRIDATDRRLSTTPRDYLQTVYSTDFASSTALRLAAIPATVEDVYSHGQRRPALIDGVRPSARGPLGILRSPLPGDVLSFELPPANRFDGDVVVYDRRGNPAATPTTPDAQAEVGWEEVYGPDQPLTPGDAPVLDNGLVRIRPTSSTAAAATAAAGGAVFLFVLEAWDGAAWVEQGRLQPFGYADGTAVTFPTFRSANVEEWTPERAVIRYVADRPAGAANPARAELYVTLERGWTGPRVEMYVSTAAAATTGAALRFSSAFTDEGALWQGASSAGAGAAAPTNYRDSAVSAAWGNDRALVATFAAAGLEPWAAWQSQNAAARLVIAAPTAASDRLELVNASLGAYDVARDGFGISTAYTQPQVVSYVGVRYAFGQRGAVVEADAYPGSIGTNIADAAAVNGTTRNSPATADGSSANVAQIAPALGAGARFGLWARVRATTAGDTVSVKWIQGSGVAGTPATTTSTTYVWLYLGEVDHPDPVGVTLYLRAWRSAGTGTGGVNVDRVAAIPLERRAAGGAHDGARDFGQAALYDVRRRPQLLER